MAKKKGDSDSDGKLFDKLWSSDPSVRDEALRNHPNIGGYLPTPRQDAAAEERPIHRSGEPVSRDLAAGRHQGRRRSKQD